MDDYHNFLHADLERKKLFGIFPYWKITYYFPKRGKRFREMAIDDRRVMDEVLERIGKEYGLYDAGWYIFKCKPAKIVKLINEFLGEYGL